jgi:hypothetical protein
MSVGDGFMITVTSARTDSTSATGGEVVPRRRGKSKAPNFTYEGPVSVIRLELDVSDEPTRRRVQRQWAAVFRLRRALQRDAAARCGAYWVAHQQRAADAKAVRDRLGLSRKGMEASAKAHIEASGWMRDHLTKAIGLHMADEVWETVDRHLFADSSGRRHGPPRVGSWWDFTRIPGRARSHTKTTPVWETYRLVGTLDGHLGAYRHPQLSAAVTTARQAAGQPAGTSILSQPTHLPAPPRPASGKWADHGGALAVVFTGLPGGEVVLPVRLPQGAGQWAHLCHFLADPSVWHKIDLIRVRDRKAPGGWRYYAHLLVHQAGYQAPATRARRVEIPTDRRAGVDANVSNLALASFPDGQPEQLRVDQITCTDEQQRAAARAAKRARARQRVLDRSRRNTNREQYGPSVRHKRAERRAERGLKTRQITNPGGSRRARTDGAPLRAYRHDRLSNGYHRTRVDHATEVRTISQAKHARARDVAARIVHRHGNSITVEDCSISTWARLWGKRIALFSPGMLVAALAGEAPPPVAGCIGRALDPPRLASTACVASGCPRPWPSAPTTAQRAGSTVTATLFPRPWRAASTSPIPTIRAPRASTMNLPTPCGRGWPPSKSGRAQSTGTSHQHHPMLDRPGPAATIWWPLLSEQHSAHPRTDQAPLDVAGPAEKNSTPSCSALHDLSRVNS